jgi:hypothetical protein
MKKIMIVIAILSAMIYAENVKIANGATLRNAPSASGDKLGVVKGGSYAVLDTYGIIKVEITDGVNKGKIGYQYEKYFSIEKGIATVSEELGVAIRETAEGKLLCTIKKDTKCKVLDKIITWYKIEGGFVYNCKDNIE